MKKLLSATLFLLVAFAANAQGEFTIEGKLTGVEDGTVILLCRSEGRLMSTFATDTLRNQTFHFQGQTIGNDSECLMLDVRDKGFPSTWLDVWVAPGAKVTIEGTDKLLRTWRVSSNVKEQKFQTLYIDAIRDLKNQQQRLIVRINELMMNKPSTEVGMKAAIDEIKAIDRQIEQLELQEFPIVQKLMQENPIDKAWIDLLEGWAMQARYMENFPYRDEVVALYNRLSDADKKTEKGKTITVYLFPPVTVKEGDEMADADLFDLDGKVHHLAEYKGKYMLLDFWSRGCGPCRMALPEMKEIADMYKDRLTVISLSSDDEKNWREVSKEENLTWENLNDMQGTNGLYAKYGISGIPHYVFISPEGKVLTSWSGYGKNGLKMKLKVLLDIPKHEMSITQKGNVKQVNYPTKESTNVEYLIIKQVELGDTATAIHFKVYFTPNYWINFSPTTSLTTEDGKKYSVKSAEGVTLGKKFVMPESGETELTLYFEPLPKDTKVFNYIEGESRDDWQIKGIRLSLPEK